MWSCSIFLWRCSNSKFMKQSCDAQKKGHCTFSDIIMFLPATRAKAKFATIGGGGLPPLGKPWPPDAGCHGTLLSRPLGQFLAFWPWLLVETRPVGNARKKDQNAPETKCYFKPSREAKHGSIGQSKTLSGNSWPFGLWYPWNHITSVMLGRKTEIPLRRNVIFTGPARQSMTLSGKETLRQAIVGRLASETREKMTRR